MSATETPVAVTRSLPSLIRYFVWLILGLAAAAGIYVLWHQREALVSVLSELSLSLVAAVLALTSVGYVLRIIRWQWLLSSLGSYVPPWVNGLAYIGGFAFTATPAKAGEAGRALLLQPYAVPVSRTVGLCGAERIMDLAAVMLIAAVGTSLFSQYAWLLWTGFAMLLCALLILRNDAWMQALLRKIKHWGGDLVLRPVMALERLLVDVRHLLRAGRFSGGIALGVCGWMMEVSGFWLLAGALGVSMSFVVSSGVYAFSLLAGALSFLPGGLVGMELVMLAMLTSMGVATEVALALTLSARLLTLGYSIAIGWLALLGFRLVRRASRVDASH